MAAPPFFFLCIHVTEFLACPPRSSASLRDLLFFLLTLDFQLSFASLPCTIKFNRGYPIPHV